MVADPRAARALRELVENDRDRTVLKAATLGLARHPSPDVRRFLRRLAVDPARPDWLRAAALRAYRRLERPERERADRRPGHGRRVKPADAEHARLIARRRLVLTLLKKPDDILARKQMVAYYRDPVLRGVATLGLRVLGACHGAHAGSRGDRVLCQHISDFRAARGMKTAGIYTTAAGGGSGLVMLLAGAAYGGVFKKAEEEKVKGGALALAGLITGLTSVAVGIALVIHGAAAESRAYDRVLDRATSPGSAAAAAGGGRSGLGLVF
jgi:hypothetical protein